MLASEWVREIVCYVAVDDMVWRVRRVNSAALAAEGYAHLEGSEAYRAVQAEIARERREHLASLNQTDPEARAAAIAQVGLADRSRALRRLEALQSTEEGQKALQARCDAYLCASIDGGARLRTPVSEPQQFASEPPIVGEWGPWRWVRDDEGDPAQGRVPVGYLSATARQLLGLAIQSAQGGLTRQRVTTFRPGPGAAPAPAPAGGGLPHGPGGGAGVEPGAPGGGDGSARAAGA
jgi:hypothetical protein